MCNCARKCAGFPEFPQFVVVFPVKRFAGDSRAKSPLPSHKKAAARDSTTSLRAATFYVVRIYTVALHVFILSSRATFILKLCRDRTDTARLQARPRTSLQIS